MITKIHLSKKYSLNNFEKWILAAPPLLWLQPWWDFSCFLVCGQILYAHKRLVCNSHTMSGGLARTEWSICILKNVPNKFVQHVRRLLIPWATVGTWIQMSSRAFVDTTAA